MAEYQYMYTTAAMGSLLIEDPGNYAVKAFTDAGEEFVLVIRTTLGTTNIFTCGPIAKGVDLLHKSTRCEFKRINYAENKVNTAIRNFLNNPFTNITQAYETTKQDALADCVSLIEYMKRDDTY